MAVNISSFVCDDITDDSTKDLVDEETCNTDDWLAKTRIKMIINLKIALKASKDALAKEKQKRVNDKMKFDILLNDVRKKHNLERSLEQHVSAWSQRSQSVQASTQPTQCDQIQQTLPPELANRSRPTTHGICIDNSMQTLVVPSADLSVQTESNDEEHVPPSSEDDAVALHAEADKLKRRVAELVYMNNRYHLALSNCTFCASDEPDSPDASTFLDASIRASTPLSSLDSSPAELSSTIPALMSITWDRRQADNEQKSKGKDQTFINRMVKALTKLETKYRTPEHRRKKRLFTRKQRTCSIVPKELVSIYNDLAAPEPEAVAVPEPFPHVRWSEVRFKPALPNPELCPVFSCSQDPGFYQEKHEYRNGSVIPTVTEPEFLRKDCPPFGTLPGYKTSRGVVAIPTTPVGGYVYCPDAKKWVLYAEPCSSPSAGRGTRRGDTPLTRRRKG